MSYHHGLTGIFFPEGAEKFNTLVWSGQKGYCGRCGCLQTGDAEVKTRATSFDYWPNEGVFEKFWSDKLFQGRVCSPRCQTWGRLIWPLAAGQKPRRNMDVPEWCMTAALNRPGQWQVLDHLCTPGAGRRVEIEDYLPSTSHGRFWTGSTFGIGLMPLGVQFQNCGTGTSLRLSQRESPSPITGLAPVGENGTKISCSP
jgi:hypothetical protein